MDLEHFIKERKPAWRRLEAMLAQVEGSGLRSLNDEEAIRFGQLYRRAASDLNQAQTFLTGDDIVGYLNRLVARGYLAIYGGAWQVRFGKVLVACWRGYAQALRRHFGMLCVATGLTLAGAALAFVLLRFDPSFIEYVMPESFNTIRPDEDGGDGGGGRSMSGDEITAFSGMLFFNNTRVTLFAFALGLTFGIGTCYLLFYNGLILGAIALQFWKAGQLTSFLAEVLPHGVLELPAIMIGGAAGLILARGMIVARPWSRMDEMIRSGREALIVVMGTVPLLAIAAVLEAGVARLPRGVLGDWAKLTIASTVGLLFVTYGVLAGRGGEQPPPEAAAHG
jgi:uncharacterized membrane protein SpoIIM required for sporulation